MRCATATSSHPPARSVAKQCGAWQRRGNRGIGGAGLPSVLVGLELREIEVPDGALDQPAVVLAVEHLAGHAAGRHERERGHLGTDLLERTPRLRLDLAVGLLEAALAVLLDLVLGTLALRVGDHAGVREDALGLAARLADQGAVLFEQLARL